MYFLSGGSTLYIETTLTRPLNKLKADSEGSVTLTGNLGDVMKESTKIAHTFAKHFLSQQEPDNDFLEKAHLHLHVPEVCYVTTCMVIFLSIIKSHISGSNTERRTVSRLHHGDGHAVARNEQTCAPEHRNDGRSVAHREGASHRRREGEDDRGKWHTSCAPLCFHPTAPHCSAHSAADVIRVAASSLRA